jgi:hypothetical protein
MHKINKYPITSVNGNEYLVDIYSKYYSCGLYDWCADVYIKNSKPKTFYRKEFIKVCKWSVCWDYDKWEYRYKDTAIEAVECYEKTIQEKIDHKVFIKIEEEKWNLWDGII